MWRTALLFVVAVALLSGCAKGERASVADLVKEASSAARAKARVKVSIRLAADEPTDEEQAMLRSLEAAVEKDKIGRLVSSGSEPGYVFVTVEVEQTADAIEKLRAILLRAGLLKRASFKVITAT